MKKIYFIIVCFFIIFNSYSDVSDDFIADELSKSLIESYDENYKGRKFLEVLVLKIGKPTFIDSVLSWRKNYKDSTIGYYGSFYFQLFDCYSFRRET